MLRTSIRPRHQPRHHRCLRRSPTNQRSRYQCTASPSQPRLRKAKNTMVSWAWLNQEWILFLDYDEVTEVTEVTQDLELDNNERLNPNIRQYISPHNPYSQYQGRLGRKFYELIFDIFASTLMFSGQVGWCLTGFRFREIKVDYNIVHIRYT